MRCSAECNVVVSSQKIACPKSTVLTRYLAWSGTARSWCQSRVHLDPAASLGGKESTCGPCLSNRFSASVASDNSVRGTCSWKTVRLTRSSGRKTCANWPCVSSKAWSLKASLSAPTDCPCLVSAGVPVWTQRESPGRLPSPNSMITCPSSALLYPRQKVRSICLA